MAIERVFAVSVAVLAGAFCAGCAPEYLARSDRIEPTAGDAVRANIVTHVIDPWPSVSRSPVIVLPAGRLPVTTTRPVSAGPAGDRAPVQSGFGQVGAGQAGAGLR